MAAARMARFQGSGLRTSLLPVSGAAGVESVGLHPVGEVMGCIVEHIGWTGWGGCGYYGVGGLGGFGGALGGIGGFGGMGGGTVSSGRGGGRVGLVGYRPYVEALYRGYGTAVDRMVTEARAMDADGVVGVAVSVSQLGSGNREFVTLGTAVRADCSARPAEVFTTDLPGQDVAKLLQAGWAPAGIAFGIAVAIRHDDWATVRQASWGAGNTEVSGYTELLTTVRADARHRFREAVAAAGADGAIVSKMGLEVWEIEPGENHRDHVAESTVTGTTLVRFHGGHRSPTRSLTVLPLR